MKYIERVGDKEIIYEGTPKDIALAKHLMDNKLVYIPTEGAGVSIDLGVSECALVENDTLAKAVSKKLKTLEMEARRNAKGRSY